jgi:two-component system chemotaxis family response regulator WspR
LRESVTVSVGIGCATVAPEVTPEQLLRSADRALYAAKSGGRNRPMIDGDLCLRD